MAKRSKKKTKKTVPTLGGMLVPDDVAAEMRKTLVGQLRLQLGELITGRKNVAPIFRQILRYLRETSLANVEIGNIDHTIFYGEASLTEYDALPFVTDVAKLLKHLEDEAWNDFRFLEVRGCPPPLPITLGAAVSDATLLLPGGGKLYVITFLSAAYPKGILARLEIRASRANPDRTFSVFTGEGWKSFTVSTADSEPWVNRPS